MASLAVGKGQPASRVSPTATSSAGPPRRSHHRHPAGPSPRPPRAVKPGPLGACSAARAAPQFGPAAFAGKESPPVDGAGGDEAPPPGPRRDPPANPDHDSRRPSGPPRGRSSSPSPRAMRPAQPSPASGSARGRKRSSPGVQSRWPPSLAFPARKSPAWRRLEASLPGSQRSRRDQLIHHRGPIPCSTSGTAGVARLARQPEGSHQSVAPLKSRRKSPWRSSAVSSEAGQQACRPAVSAPLARPGVRQLG